MANTNDLSRFVTAQQGVYEKALREIKSGRKTGHWMWFVFPQIQGLGRSETARFYAIRDRSEALAYLAHPVLGTRLVEISRALLQVPGGDAVAVFGSIDSIKLRSSMTLFVSLPGADPVFSEVLEKYFKGSKDEATIALLDS